MKERCFCHSYSHFFFLMLVAFVRIKCDTDAFIIRSLWTNVHLIILVAIFVSILRSYFKMSEIQTGVIMYDFIPILFRHLCYDLTEAFLKYYLFLFCLYQSSASPLLPSSYGPWHKAFGHACRCISPPLFAIAFGGSRLERKGQNYSAGIFSWWVWNWLGMSHNFINS